MTMRFDDRSVLNLIEVKCLGVQSNTVRVQWRVHYREQVFVAAAPWRCEFWRMEACEDLMLVCVLVASILL